MGTRNLTMVVSEGKTKVAQYGQWDGYPEGQGATALNFLRKADLKQFKEKVDALEWLTEEELKAIDVAGDWTKTHPHLSRDRGAEILELVYNGSATKLMNKEGFAGDSLMNEWTYVVDLDKNTFEVYEGFNKEPLQESDRFYSCERDTEGEYYPVKMVKSYDINSLPTEEEFIADFTEKEDKPPYPETLIP